MGGRKQKGQITILLVLVLVLLIVFGLMFFIKSGLVKDILSGATGTLGAAEAKTKFTESVEACIQHATQEGLVLVGRQGGAIYNTQVEGTAPLLPGRSLLYDEVNISYGIRKGDSPEPPGYPIEGPLGSVSLEGYIGTSVLKPLCDADGPNVWDIAGAEHTCISYDLPASPHSIQDYLRAYILNKTLECMTLSEWASQYGVGIVPQGDAELEVIIGDSDVTVQLTYPLQVGGSAVSSFAYQSKVRLKKVYELAYRLAEADISDLTFFVDDESSVGVLRTCPSVDRQNNNEPCLKKNMSAEVIDAPCTACPEGEFADIVRINDSKSLILGEPYVFQFARENRRPALDQIDEATISGKYNTYLQERHGKTENPFRKTQENPYPDKYDVVVTAGDEIELIPYGLDPDEDVLTYSYEGWLTGTVLNDHKHQNKDCMGGGPCMDPFKLKPVDAGGGTINKWEQNAQGDWRTHNTHYETKSGDAGYKLLRITVCDTEGLCDWQDLGILVNDRPEFTLTGADNCCTNCQLTIDSDDKYYASYHIEISDEENGNDCVDETTSTWPTTVTFAPTGGPCSSLQYLQSPTVITVRVTDEFGSSAERTFTACPS